MGLKLNATNGGGSVELDVPNTVNSDLALTVPAAAGTIDRLERPGNIVQIVRASTNTEITVTNDTYTDIGLSVNITPQYADSILIVNAVIQYNYFRSSTNAGAGVRLLRGTDVIWQNAQNSVGPLGSYTNATGATLVSGYIVSPVMYFDTTHNSTSQLTYHFEGRPYASSNSGQVSFQIDSGVVEGESLMTIMEVKV